MATRASSRSTSTNAAGIPLPDGGTTSEDDDSPDVSTSDNFSQEITIDTNEPVGNMSISPGNRDLVLAARKGLYIIDLDNPKETPRFLPQGGTWEVADVQWNPHPVNSQYIVSTSSQKLLIWNLHMRGKTAIQHILHAHYRAITDINWHSHDPNLVASCGIDSWIWVWDIRVSGKKNVSGFCAWNDGATQVKWNRLDPHVLASAHRDSVLLWDDRKGSLPVGTLHAHTAKVYGIDWSRTETNRLVTCSLDSTIKLWDTSNFSAPPRSGDNLSTFSSESSPLATPLAEIQTDYPVWRARHLPFGNGGILSLPQRGDNALEMWNFDEPEAPIKTFDGHTGLVKEYVWRSRGGANLDFDDRNFQLVTLANDRTVKLWPIDSKLQERAGFVYGAPIKMFAPRHGAPSITYRVVSDEHAFPGEVDDPHSHLSAPLSQQGILGSVRASSSDLHHPVRGRQNSISYNQSQMSDLAPASSSITDKSSPLHLNRMVLGGSGGISLPPQNGKSLRHGVDQLAWFSSVTVGRREDSQLGGSGSIGTRSGGTSRVGSRSRTRAATMAPRSLSRSREPSGGDVDMPKDLADEVATITKQFIGKITHEKTDMSKRSCSFGLHGPWGEDGAVIFVRVAFRAFPKEYPRSLSSTEKPSVEIERGTSMPLRTRAVLLRSLRQILAKEAPALDSCMRLLLGLSKKPKDLDDDDDGAVLGADANTKDIIDLSTPRARTCGAVFGPNGQLVCFFEAKAKAARSRVGEIGVSQSDMQKGANGKLLEAMWGLQKLANDGSPISELATIRKPMFHDAFFHRQPSMHRSRTQDSFGSIEDAETSRVTTRSKSSVLSIKDMGALSVLDRTLGTTYVMTASDPLALCHANLAAAHAAARFDHARAWQVLRGALSLLTSNESRSVRADGDTAKPGNKQSIRPGWDAQPHLRIHFRRAMNSLFDIVEQMKDLQLLAMLSIAVLSVDRFLTAQSLSSVAPAEDTGPTLETNLDYFNHRRVTTHQVPIQKTAQENRTVGQSPARTPITASTPSYGWPRFSPRALSSPGGSGGPSTSSSKGSWSSLLTSAASYRHLLSGGLVLTESTSSRRDESSESRPDLNGSASGSGSVTPVPFTSSVSIPHPRRSLLPRTSHSTTALSAKDSPPNPMPSPATSSGPRRGRGDPPILQGTRMNLIKSLKGDKPRAAGVVQFAPTSKPLPTKVEIVPVGFKTTRGDQDLRVLDPKRLLQYEAHIRAYADVLWRWGCLIRRAEMLNLVRTWGIDREETTTMVEICTHCGQRQHTADEACVTLGRKQRHVKARCTICHLPTHGLTFTCVKCCHITHLSCWQSRPLQLRKSCPSGCGCDCKFDTKQQEVKPTVVIQLPSVSPSLTPVTEEVQSRWGGTYPRRVSLAKPMY